MTDHDFQPEPTSPPDRGAQDVLPSNGNGRPSGPEVDRRKRAAVDRLHRLEEAVLEARDDREAYRRVLAAAIANEKNAEGRVKETLVEREQATTSLRTAVSERGHALGRADELDVHMKKLENQLDDLERAKRQELVEIRERLEAEARQELLERAIAQGRIQELEAQLARTRPGSWRLLALGTRATLSASILLYLVTVAMLPPAFRLLRNRPAAESWTRDDFVTGGLFLGCLLLALGLHAVGYRLLRSEER